MGLAGDRQVRKRASLGTVSSVTTALLDHHDHDHTPTAAQPVPVTQTTGGRSYDTGLWSRSALGPRSQQASSPSALNRAWDTLTTYSTSLVPGTAGLWPHRLGGASGSSEAYHPVGAAIPNSPSSDIESRLSADVPLETDDVFQDRSPPPDESTITVVNKSATATAKQKRSSQSLSDVVIDTFAATHADEGDNGWASNAQCHQCIYLAEEELTIDVYGYRYNTLALYLYYLLCVLSLGVVYLLGRWFAQRRIGWLAQPHPLHLADWLVVTNEWGNFQIETIVRRYYGGTYASVFATSTSATTSPLLSPMVLDTTAATPLTTLVYFEHRHNRFLLDPLCRRFTHICAWKDSSWAKAPLEIRRGLSLHQHTERTILFGSNAMDIPEKPLLQFLMDEILHPFYIFQIMSIVLWFSDDYYYYAGCILVISVVSIFTTYRETRKNERKMREMARLTCSVWVYRSGTWLQIPSTELVPGDVFELSDPHLHQIPCDAVLLEGDCIVNESMLTGESIPVSKCPATLDTMAALDLTNLSPGPEISRHMLFCGTKIIRVRATTRGMGGDQWRRAFNEDGAAKATALVVRTGFNTIKGSLVRSILFPRPNKFKFYQDAFRFVGVMAVIAVLGFMASIAYFVELGYGAGVIIKRALDLITIVVPPALPATMSIGTSFALSRLRKQYIYCISPPRINVSGKVNIMCFDKTGTLTEDGLDVLGAQCMLASHPDHLGELCDTAEKLPDGRSASPASPVRLLHALATCHSLKVVDGEVVGDPIDIKMFEFTGWTLEEEGNEPTAPLDPNHADSAPPAATNMATTASPVDAAKPTLEPTKPLAQQFQDGLVPTVVRPPNSQRFTLESFMANPDSMFELGIIRSFEFLPSLRRMSVIVKPIQSPTMQVYVKGAPEAMLQICRPESIPTNFHTVLDEYTHHGYRVIGCAGKSLAKKVNWLRVQRLQRDQVEADLEFLGFVVFENKLKPTTAEVIRTLGNARIRQAMCTGDNVLTAVSVARECGIVDPDQAVYTARCLEGSFATDGASARLVWENVDHPEQVLDPYSLEPLGPSPSPHGSSLSSSSSLTPVPLGDTQACRRPLTQHNHVVTMTTTPPVLSSQPRHCVALTGDAMRWILEHSPLETIEQMLIKGQVFARMSPDEKQVLVEKLQGLDYCVGFCGDGANDCGALKAADVGLSLSEAEASVAAPFTSRSTDITCVLDLIKEGRCALTTSFSCFKYMALYSIIQFVCVSLLYSQGAGLGDFQFLYIDLFIIIPMAVFMGNSPPYHRLHVRPPTASLISQPVLSSLFGHIAVVFSFQIFIFLMIRRQSDWYSPPDRSHHGSPDKILIECYENTVLFLLANFQYIFMAVVFSIGPPYRQSSLKNYPFIAISVLLLAFSVVVTVVPHGFWVSLFELVPIPSSFSWIIVGTAAVNCLVFWIAEKYLLTPLSALVIQWTQWIWPRVTGKPLSRRRKRYRDLEGVR
ncbi:hypothetical protein H4R34_004894 [Dimargaris verticillata]|uniref:Cation-transporting ATPase n=1 Tax=Dimargaris verticillata TaxID=2761393 RepID=A0A9W8B4N5_9FUNG|nr:hypothetical protein H4R34_004894 [Dimargaris verticillata]